LATVPGDLMSAKIKCSSSRTQTVPFGETFGVPSGQTVATIEAMKLEASITAPVGGTVARLVVAGPRRVEAGDLPEEKVQNAAIDGLWQTLMLAGAMELVPMQGEVISYEAPAYYGMIVASFAPVRKE
jgi:hypothetical protein